MKKIKTDKDLSNLVKKRLKIYKINTYDPRKLMYDLYDIAVLSYGIPHIKAKLEIAFNPTNDFPYVQHYLPSNVSKIYVTKDSQLYLSQMVFQLSHEIIHALMPNDESSNWLEEAVATHFSIIVSETLKISLKKFYNRNTKYMEAVNILRENNLHQPETIKKIRQLNSALNKVTVEDILNIIDIPIENIHKLLAEF